MKYRNAGKEEASARHQPNRNTKNYGEVTEREARVRNCISWLSKECTRRHTPRHTHSQTHTHTLTHHTLSHTDSHTHVHIYTLSQPSLHLSPTSKRASSPGSALEGEQQVDFATLLAEGI